MGTEVLLMAKVSPLGDEGDVVTVADGYARNYLLPKKLAAPVNEATRRRLAKLQKERGLARQEEKARFRELAKLLAKASCTIPVKTGDDGKMYGSVTASDIAEMLTSQGVEIDRQWLHMEQPIKELGVFDVKAKLHPEVEAVVKVWVVEE